MKIIQCLLLIIVITLSSCVLSPQQKAEREAKRIRAEQNLQIQLAKQCDVETAELMQEYFNPQLKQSEKERKVFEKRYLTKVNQPIFQACYKLALENYKTQQEIRYMQMHYDDFHFGFSRFCYACW